MHILDELEARGLIKDVTHADALRARMDEGPVTFYCGYDPTSDSLTLGNAVPLMLQAHLQRAGHRPVVVMGGATGLVGDPTGKDKSRVPLTSEQLAENLAGQRPVFGRVLELEDDEGAGPQAARIVDNASWFAGIGYLEFLRDVGRHFSVNEMITADTYARRLQANQHLSFIEFNYRCLQAYDFLHLYRAEGVELQVGGSDQWGNCVAGTELIRKVIPGARAWVMTCPLLLTADGQKMGKTEGGAVFVGAHKTSPYDLYQYCVNVPDPEVGKLLRTFTFLPLDEIARLEQRQGAAINDSKRRLAWEVTALFPGAEEADRARDAAAALFADGGAIDDVPTVELPSGTFEGEGIALYKLLVEAGLQASGKAAKSLTLQGGAYVNDARESDPLRKVTSDDLVDGALLLRAGKKKYCRVVVV
jgi:tyrosyl-tRNA synthetase